MALLINNTSSLKIDDFDNPLNLPPKVDEHDDYVDRQILAQAKEVQKVSLTDSELIQTFEHQLEQASRNAL